MIKNKKIKTLIPHISAVLVFLVIAAIYFMPQLEGKVIQQSDIVSHKGMAHEIREFRQETGENTLWTNAMFGGMPAYQISAPSYKNLFRYVDDIFRLGINRPIGTFFMAMASFYLLMLVLGINPWLAAIGAIAFGFNTNNLILFETGHTSKLSAIAYFPLITAGVLLAYRKKMWLGAGLFTVGMALNLYANHPQMTYYLGMALFIYIIFRAVRAVREKTIPEFIKVSLLLLVGAILAIGSSASKLWTTYEYSKDTMRGDPILETSAGGPKSSSETKGLEWGYAMQWSNGLIDIFATMIPGVAGGGSQEEVEPDSEFSRAMRQQGLNPGGKAPLYWGPLPFTSGPAYIGAIVFLLFFIGLFSVKGDLKWWLGIAVLVTILLSMGKHFSILNRPLFDLLPLYNKFRAPSSILSLTAFLVPTLGFYGIQKILDQQKSGPEFMKRLYYAGGIMGAICLFFLILGPSMFSMTSPSDAQYQQYGIDPSILIEDRKALMRSDALRSFFLVFLAFGLIWAWVKSKVNKPILLAGLGLLILIDLWGVGKRYLDDSDFVSETRYEQNFTPRPVDQQIMQDPDPNYRVLDLSINTFNSSISSYFHKTIGGYHAAKLQRFQDMIDYHISEEMQRIPELLQSLPNPPPDSLLKAKMMELDVLNMLNTKYIIFGNRQEQQPLQNPAAYGNAWFVDIIKEVETANEEINALNTINPAKTAVVHADFADYVEGFDPAPKGNIKLTSYAPNRLVYESNSPAEQLAVFSEVWYGPDKGWNAYIDGEPVDHIRVNYILRALRVPAGTHEIEFVFDPVVYKRGEQIALFTSLIALLGFIGISGYRGYQWWTREETNGKKKKKSRKKRRKA